MPLIFNEKRMRRLLFHQASFDTSLIGRLAFSACSWHSWGASSLRASPTTSQRRFRRHRLLVVDDYFGAVGADVGRRREHKRTNWMRRECVAPIVFVVFLYYRTLVCLCVMALTNRAFNHSWKCHTICFAEGDFNFGMPYFGAAPPLGWANTQTIKCGMSERRNVFHDVSCHRVVWVDKECLN